MEASSHRDVGTLKGHNNLDGVLACFESDTLGFQERRGYPQVPFAGKAWARAG